MMNRILSLLLLVFISSARGNTPNGPQNGYRNYFHEEEGDHHSSSGGVTGRGREFEFYNNYPDYYNKINQNVNSNGNGSNRRRRRRQRSGSADSSSSGYLSRRKGAIGGRAGVVGTGKGFFNDNNNNLNNENDNKNMKRSPIRFERSASASAGSNDDHSKDNVQSFKDWITGLSTFIPRVQVKADPTTTFKVRKRFRPFKTIITLGADYSVPLGVWQFKSSWEDSIIGGRLTLAGRELQLSKTWLLSVGAVDDLVTRLRFRAAVDVATGKAYARFGFRTERLSPINVVEGFAVKRLIPVDNSGKINLEVKANFSFPEPEIEYSTDSHRTVVGMGDIEVSLEELNLLFDL